MDPEDSSRPPRGTVHVTPEVEHAALPVPVETPVLRPQRGFRWGAVFWTAIGGLILLGVGLGVTRLIEDLFAHSEGLGFVGLTFAFSAALAFAVVVAREAFGLARLAAIEKLHLRAAAVLASDDRAESRAIVRELLRLEHQNPQLARARATLQGHTDDIIDGADLIRLAEREVMTPLAEEASRLVSSAAQRGSLVTAVSPRPVTSPARCRSRHCPSPYLPISPRTCCASAMETRSLSGAGWSRLNKTAARGRPDLISFKPETQKSSAISRKPGPGELASHSHPRTARERDGRQAPRHRPAPARNKPAAAEGAAMPERHQATLRQ